MGVERKYLKQFQHGKAHRDTFCKVELKMAEGTHIGMTFICMGSIGGEIVKYDACGTGKLEGAKLFYEPCGFEYIGTGHIHSIDGRNQNDK